jgi:hypothetical protein
MIRRLGALVAAGVALGSGALLISTWRDIGPSARMADLPPGAPGDAAEGERRSQRFAFAGCARISDGPVCHLGPSDELRIFVPGPSRDVRLLLDGEPQAVRTATVPDGVRASLRGLGEGTLELRTDDDSKHRPWSLELRTLETPSVLETAQRLAEQQDRAGLSRLVPHTHWVAVERELLLARVARRQSEVERALRHQERAATRAERSGELSLYVKARLAKSHALAFELHDLAAARRELELLEPIRSRVPDLEAYAPYYRAIVRLEAGDITGAIADLRRSETWARRLGLTALLRYIGERRATIDLALGHRTAGISRMRELLRAAADRGDGCEESILATNLTWALVSSCGAACVDEARRVGRHALELSTTACPDASDAANDRTNLALAALHAGELDEARRWLDAVDAAAMSTQFRLGLLEVEARVALARGEVSAAFPFARRLIAEAEAASRAHGIYRGHVLMADLFSRAGRSSRALEARQKAEAVLDRMALRVPLIGARHAFLTARDDNVRELVDLLVEAGHPKAAMDALRRARARSFGWARISPAIARLPPARLERWSALIGAYRDQRRALDRAAEADWTLAASELKAARARRAGLKARLEALLTEALDLLPSVRVRAPPPSQRATLHLGWVRLASGPIVLGVLDDDAFVVPWEGGDRLPDAVAQRLGRADRVRLHPYGDFVERDLHALKWRNAPLAARVPVAYALDLSDDPGFPPLRAALVVVDPEGALERGRAEADLVRAGLRPTGMRVDLLRPARVDVGRLREALGRADWFHFGGHGSYDPADPWSGGLALGDAARLGLGDILTLPKAPSVVVLTSCEAGRSAARGGEAMGIAHALVSAGARFVVGPSRRVSDEAAFRFAQAFYRASGSPSARYREAFTAMGSEAAPFRVFAP